MVVKRRDTMSTVPIAKKALPYLEVGMSLDKKDLFGSPFSCFSGRDASKIKSKTHLLLPVDLRNSLRSVRKASRTNGG